MPATSPMMLNLPFVAGYSAVFRAIPTLPCVVHHAGSKRLFQRSYALSCMLSSHCRSRLATRPTGE